MTRWVKAMNSYAEFLVNVELAPLRILELSNLFTLLDLVQDEGNAEATIDLATLLYTLLQSLGKPRLLGRVGDVRDAAALALGGAWNHAQCKAALTRIEQQLAAGRLQEACERVHPRSPSHRCRQPRPRAF